MSSLVAAWGAGEGLATSPATAWAAGEGMATSPAAAWGAGEGLATSPATASGAGEGLATSPAAASGAGEGLATSPAAAWGADEGMATSPTTAWAAGEGLATSSATAWRAGEGLATSPATAWAAGEGLATSPTAASRKRKDSLTTSFCIGSPASGGASEPSHAIRRQARIAEATTSRAREGVGTTPSSESTKELSATVARMSNDYGSAGKWRKDAPTPSPPWATRWRWPGRRASVPLLANAIVGFLVASG